MGLFDIFKKKNQVDGTYHRPPDRDGTSEDYYTNAAYGDYTTFRITVQDVFSITGRGTVITGQIESGTVKIGDTVTLRRTDGSSRDVTITGIEMFRKMLDTAEKGDNVGLLLRGVGRNEVNRGDILEKLG